MIFGAIRIGLSSYFFITLISSKSNTGISFHGVVQNILFFWFEIRILLNRKCPSIMMKEYQLFKVFI
jgi:hypothetical protein